MYFILEWEKEILDHFRAITLQNSQVFEVGFALQKSFILWQTNDWKMFPNPI